MKKRIQLIGFLLVVSVAFSFSTISAIAGVSPIITVNDDDFKSEIGLEWVFEDGVEYGDNSIVFVDSSDKSSQIISRTYIENLVEAGYRECFDASFTLLFEEIEGKFGFVFGLRSAVRTVGSDNTSFVYFFEDNGLKLGVSNFNDDAEEIVVATATVSPATEYKTRVRVDTSGGITVAVNGTEIISESGSSCATDGYVGFGQTSGNSVEITHVEIAAYTNDRPENPDIFETFDDDTFNSTVFYSSSQQGFFPNSLLKVENGELAFKNVAESFISTRYQYSNFIMEFDLTELAREPLFDEDRNLIRPISTSFAVSFGSQSSSQRGGAFDIEFYPFGGGNTKPALGTAVSLKVGGEIKQAINLPDKYNIWSEHAVSGKTVNIRITVKNCVVTVQLKYDDETGFNTVLSEDIGLTPLGYVQIKGSGTSAVTGASMPLQSITQGNFCIDNLSVVNFDTAKKSIVVGYTSNVWEIPKDFVFEDTWDDSDLLGNRGDKK